MASPAELFQNAFAAFQQGHLQEAERGFSKFLRKNPKHFPALNILAIVLVALKRHAEAEPYLKAALRINATSDATFYNYGLVLKALNRPDEALQRFTEALALNPGNAETLNNRGTVLNDLRDYPAALADFDRALALNPRYAAAFFNKSKSLAELKRYDEALAACESALALQPDLAEAWFGRGYIFGQMRMPAEAVEAYGRACQLNPDMPLLKGNLLHQKMLVCDWHDANALIAEIGADLIAGKLAAEPFGWQGVATSERSLQRCAELTNASRFPMQAPPLRASATGPNAKIRVGYLSGEFRQQATSLLLVGVLEQHDKSAFEIFAIDNGYDDGSDIRRRIAGAVDGIVDISTLNDPQAVAAIRAQRIDILVNLNGYFGEQRTGVFARRAAPVQVNYLGFPGTLGAGFMDYILADQYVLPAEHRQFYSEKVAWLPHCYQANDDRREISTRAFTRAEVGLPVQGFVFCCFNNAYKITPDVFDSWTRILSAVDSSVLWLLEDSAAAVANLRREAELRGIDPARLVFAARMSPAEHLARHRCADLFLDTLPYNAHTTASDALWAGLPLLTCRGGTFAGRVAASLLQNLGVSELIVANCNDYECMAIELAENPERLSSIREKLSANRLKMPVFDTRRLARDIEMAFRKMAERARAGLAPAHIMFSANDSGQ
ncbi:tetratricopeptide repeat protein [Tardiphaga sp. 42S5]|uniref:O-linked N-acetylglucosamine transferase, SPINDLY family protein n=1 Tax=Tardiphaga sp. 42S5 TaxID=1404799 RepID=UPI002A59CEA6|nr:tetratricopeptide repeat protein [Tardiphaga sp. 42S5]WPO41861.1 tetratricopeptide repeat protein [Tardiphaga sp. 42S5]